MSHLCLGISSGSILVCERLQGVMDGFSHGIEIPSRLSSRRVLVRLPGKRDDKDSKAMDNKTLVERHLAFVNKA